MTVNMKMKVQRIKTINQGFSQSTLIKMTFKKLMSSSLKRMILKTK
jgi:hypothetical protein